MNCCEPPVERLGFPNRGETMIYYTVTKIAFLNQAANLQLKVNC